PSGWLRREEGCCFSQELVVPLQVIDPPPQLFELLPLLAGQSLGISWGLVLTGGMNRERCSWPGMIRGVEARIDPAEGAPFRCLTLPCSSTLVRAWMSLRSRRSR